jgi:hypothetical protein
MKNRVTRWLAGIGLLAALAGPAHATGEYVGRLKASQDASKFVYGVDVNGNLLYRLPSFASCSSLPNLTGDVTSTLCATLISNGAVTAAKMAAGAAVGNIGYTPANKAGDTFTGLTTFGADILNSGTAPSLRFFASGGSADQKYWSLSANPTSVFLRAANDAYSLFNNAWDCVRGTGYTVGYCEFPVPLTLTGGYLNFTTTVGTGGYGFRDNGGIVQFKNNGKSWVSLESITDGGDANYAILPTDSYVYHSTLSAARTDTLPAASSVAPGHEVTVQDLYGVATSTNTISVQRTASDTINGSSSPVVVANTAYAGMVFVSDGVSRWSYQPNPGTGTVTNVSVADGLAGGPCSTSCLLKTTNGAVHGRLTLIPGTPVMPNGSGGGVNQVFWTPVDGNLMPIWDGTRFVMRAFSETSQTLADTTKSPVAATANTNYDMFAWDDAGTIRVTRGPPWSSDTLRGTGAGSTQLTRVNGYLVNQYTIANGPVAGAGLYVGTIRVNASGLVEHTLGTAAAGGGAAKLGVWNQFNRVPIGTMVSNSSAIHAYTTAAWRQYSASTGMQVQAVCGQTDDSTMILLRSYFKPSAASTADVSIGIGLNSTTTPSSISQGNAGNTTMGQTLATDYTTPCPLGWNNWTAMEFGGTNAQFGGTSNGNALLIYHGTY